ncbi:EF-hand domain-containing protein [Alkalimarinus coralli]|uniref:EF-hand domain-containing protein n=1 Tax=Alkalimarinus coralli TaxID=2935863 RepID=UPI00202ADD0A|nr:EF-hand domain-containing protein [Alkalimarinus coralli]
MIIRIATTALFLAFSTAAVADGMAKDAQPNSSQVQEEFSALDTDGNGKLTQEEASASEDLASSFVELDADNNGDIDISEYVLYQSPATAAGAPGDSPTETSENPSE